MLNMRAVRKLHERFRTLFVRVAHRQHVDVSFVSRVVSGERHSPKVEKNLKEEIGRMLKR